MEETSLPRRDGSVDLAKALAICAVLLIHCSANRFALFPVGSGAWLITAFWGIAARWAVPVFLLCSGALMNRPEKELPLRRLFTRYLLRLAAALGVWAGFYECLLMYMARNHAPLGELVAHSAANLLTGNTYYHFYYFYFVIALYLALPLTRLIARYASAQEVRYLLVLWVIAGCVIPFLRYFPPFSHMGSSLLYYILPPAFFAPGLGLLGWYFREHPPKSPWPGLALFLAGFLTAYLGTWHRSAAAGTLDGLFLDGFGAFTVLMAAGVFRLAQWGGRLGQRRGVVLLSQASLCIYLVHPFLQKLTRQEMFEALPPLWGVPLQVALLLGLSLVVYLVLRRVPVVNRWLV